MAKTNITVKLIGKNGNAFNLLGIVRRAMRRTGYNEAFVKQFTDEATSGDYHHLLMTILKYVEVK